MGDIHPATLEVAGEALQGYLSAVARLRDAGDLPAETVVREFFAADEAAGDVRVEWFAWGLLHVSKDGSLRDFHVLTWEQACTRHRDPAYLAVYARVAADAVMPGGQCVEGALGLGHRPTRRGAAGPSA